MIRLSAQDPAQRHEDAAGVRDRLRALADLGGVLAIDVHEDLGVVPGHWDLALVADYSSVTALEEYQAHPRHVDAVRWIDGVVSERAVVDHRVTR